MLRFLLYKFTDLKFIFISNLNIIVGSHEGATLQNIDSYVEKLESLLSSNIDPSLRNTVRNAVSHFEMIG